MDSKINTSNKTILFSINFKSLRQLKEVSIYNGNFLSFVISVSGINIIATPLGPGQNSYLAPPEYTSRTLLLQPNCSTTHCLRQQSVTFNCNFHSDCTWSTLKLQACTRIEANVRARRLVLMYSAGPVFSYWPKGLPTFLRLSEMWPPNVEPRDR